jgi:hypothetical protein
VSNVLFAAALIWYLGWAIADLSSDGNHHWIFPVAFLGGLTLAFAAIWAGKRKP